MDDEGLTTTDRLYYYKCLKFDQERTVGRLVQYKYRTLPDLAFLLSVTSMRSVTYLHSHGVTGPSTASWTVIQQLSHNLAMRTLCKD